MYFLRADYKSPQMFLAGYFIGASDRWSWWKKKMVCSFFSPYELQTFSSKKRSSFFHKTVYRFWDWIVIPWFSLIISNLGPFGNCVFLYRLS